MKSNLSDVQFHDTGSLLFLLFLSHLRAQRDIHLHTSRCNISLMGITSQWLLPFSLKSGSHISWISSATYTIRLGVVSEGRLATIPFPNWQEIPINLGILRFHYHPQVTVTSEISSDGRNRRWRGDFSPLGTNPRALVRVDSVTEGRVGDYLNSWEPCKQSLHYLTTPSPKSMQVQKRVVN
jgi:hypothetical protein